MRLYVRSDWFFPPLPQGSKHDDGSDRRGRKHQQGPEKPGKVLKVTFQDQNDIIIASNTNEDQLRNDAICVQY